ncbi:MAG: [FeFe] hydrogenase H-cluster radical SAM maturase HydE [Candidatus Pacebacteria bacterium]|nr:[FeFe] hydrogenase H-cluster radical SAM maturase HydE [Candidatus Paceibacterota bacterium]
MITASHKQLADLLRTTDAERLETLWREADTVRQANVGDDVHLRGLVEFSNICDRNCAYCGLRKENSAMPRYRMTTEEILDCARQAMDFGYGTIVLQAGEHRSMKADWLAGVIRQIKTTTPLAVTLSVGERPAEEYAQWREAGADRYLLRFETSNPELYARIHPVADGTLADRLDCLRVLRELGYETGSGVMIGIPGQTYDILARDIEMFRELDLDMIGVGPFIPHPCTPLANHTYTNDKDDRQVPNSELMTYKVLALTRLTCPRTNLPSTTALATLNRDQGRERGLARGANVVMPTLTPKNYRRLYEIYPDKACFSETPRAYHLRLQQHILDMDRTIATGQGSSLHYVNRKQRGRYACPA